MTQLEVLGIKHSPLVFKIPKGACDCHTHVFGPHDTFALSPQRKYTPPEALTHDLIQLHNGLGVDRVVIVHPSPYGSDNSCTLMALQSLGPRARGVAVIGQSTTEQELHEMHALGVRGVRINLQTEGILDLDTARSHLKWTAEKIKPLGWHIQLFTQLNIIVALASEFSKYDCDFVIDHFGLIDPLRHLNNSDLKQLLLLLEERKIWIKLSAPHRICNPPDAPEVTQLVKILIKANPHRLVWGSDWPHPGGQPNAHRNIETPEPFTSIDDGAALNRLFHWCEDSETLNRILVENPKILYDFES